MEHLKDTNSRRVLSLLVANNAGTLSRVSGLFSRRGYNIDALTVGTTEDEQISRMTITLSGDDAVLEQIIKQLYKLVDVIKIVELEKGSSLRRELVYIKVKANDETRSKIVNICNLFRANVVDVAPESLVLEIVGPGSKIEAFFDMIKPFGIIEFVRSGVTGLQRGKTHVAPAKKKLSMPED